MAVICPAILADNPTSYREQVENVAFATHYHIDITDGQFAKAQTIKLEDAWWPHTARADLHLMMDRPDDHIDDILKLNPRMAIVHAESNTDFRKLGHGLHEAGILAGIALLPDTTVESVREMIEHFDHMLIFSGDLGHFGGKTDLDLLSKVGEARAINPTIEIGWDGGVNDENAKALTRGGVDVLNVGGFIQRSDDPAGACAKLDSVIRS